MKNIIYLYIIIHCSMLIEDRFSQWQPDFRLTNNAGFSMNSSLATNENYVHAVWQDTRDTGNKIYYKRSSDNGNTWGTDTRLTNNQLSILPSVAVSGTSVHVVWEDNRDGNFEIYYKRSTDNGITWGADMRLSNETSVSGYAHVTAEGSTVHVLWRDSRSGFFDLFYRRSTDNGATWSMDSNLVAHATGLTSHASIVAEGNFVHLAFSDTEDGNYEIYYKQSTNRGISWLPNTRLTNNSSISETPSITASGGNIHLAWIDQGNNIIYKHSTNNGISWSADTAIASGIAGAPNPSIYVSGMYVHLVYGYGATNLEIYYNHSTNGGVSWSTNTQLSSSLAYATDSHISASGSAVHVIWSDSRHSSETEIYYKRNPSGNAIGLSSISSQIPRDYVLSQNYPNPFNPMTKLRFQMPNKGFVKLTIFDMLGKEVAILVNENLHPGTYEYEWDGINQPSGVYFYKIITEGFSETKKMLLVK